MSEEIDCYGLDLSHPYFADMSGLEAARIRKLTLTNRKKLLAWSWDTPYPITSGVWVRNKCYSLLLNNGSEKNRCKGVSLKQTQFGHGAFTEFLHSDSVSKYCEQSTFKRENHVLRMAHFKKRAAAKIDLRRFELLPSGHIQTLPFGHFALPLINEAFEVVNKLVVTVCELELQDCQI